MPVRSSGRLAAHLCLVAAAVIVAAGAGAAPAGAATATYCHTSRGTIIGPGDRMTFEGQITSLSGVPAVGLRTGLDRWDGVRWQPYLYLVTDGAGRVHFPIAPTRLTIYRVSWIGNASWSACVAPATAVWLSNEPHILAWTAAYNGAPYLWGGATPAGFDCSGLMLWVFGHFGRALPHNSQLQYNSVHHIATSAMLPGDLVFFGTSPTGIYHVGLYAGGGNIWHAPGTGQTVKLERIWTSAYYAGRI